MRKIWQLFTVAAKKGNLGVITRNVSWLLEEVAHRDDVVRIRTLLPCPSAVRRHWWPTVVSPLTLGLECCRWCLHHSIFCEWPIWMQKHAGGIMCLIPAPSYVTIFRPEQKTLYSDIERKPISGPCFSKSVLRISFPPFSNTMIPTIFSLLLWYLLTIVTFQWLSWLILKVVVSCEVTTFTRCLLAV